MDTIPCEVNEYINQRTKGKSRMLFPEEYTVIDLETTGLDPKYCEIIELAAIKVSKNEIVDTYQTLVRPEAEISYFITQLTGITNEMVAGAPAVQEALPPYLDFLGDGILVGHNVHFDISFLFENAVKHLEKGLPNDFVDTLRLSRKLYPELAHHRLKDMAEYLKIEVDGAHRALFDCHTTQRLLYNLYCQAEKQYGTVEYFFNTCNSVKFGRGADARLLSTDKKEFDTSHPLYGKLCVFTGTLNKMARKDAMQKVLDLGGQCGNSVTAETNFLILGNNDFCKILKGNKSSKHKKAEELKLKGNDIEIITENVFYNMLEE